VEAFATAILLFAILMLAAEKYKVTPIALVGQAHKGVLQWPL
jgi:hypothetical protein